MTDSPITDTEMNELRSTHRGRFADRVTLLSVLAALHHLRTEGPSATNEQLDGMTTVLLIAAREPDFYRLGDLNTRYIPASQLARSTAAFELGWNLGLNIAGHR